MKIAFFDTHRFEKENFDRANPSYGHELRYFEARLTNDTVSLAQGSKAICSFTNDTLNREVLTALKKMNIQLVALRSAGFNHVDLSAASELGIKVVRVPAYSPYAVAEYAVGLLLTLNRKIHKASQRVHDLNFSLEGLVGSDLHQKTLGVIGTGKIGAQFCKIMSGFEMKILAYDVRKDPSLSAMGVNYVTLDEIYRQSDVISLHCPLNETTRHLINDAALTKMKPQVFLINTGRGGLIDTQALIKALKKRSIGGAALDVYEEEETVFFRDLSAYGISDDLLARLLTFPNVLITSHQAFLTQEALNQIANTTLQNISDFESGRPLKNEIQWKPNQGQ